MPYSILITEQTAPFIEKYLNDGVKPKVELVLGAPSTYFVLPDDPATESAQIIDSSVWREVIASSEIGSLSYTIVHKF